MSWVWTRRLIRAGLLGVIALVAATCVTTNAHQCPGGSLCADGLRCHALPDVMTCVSPAQLAACEGIEENGECRVNGALGTCLAGACYVQVCGDLILDRNEACDDGNQIADDGCSQNCLSREICGDSRPDFARGEQCDTGVPGLSGDGCTSRCAIESLVWREVTAPSPPRRLHHGLATAPGGGVLLFGGTAGDYGVGFGSSLGSATTFISHGDTWHWDGVSWLRLAPDGPAPPRRTMFSIAYAPGRDRVVVFGGFGSNGQPLDDTWEWNGVAWTERTPAVRPPARAGAAFACSQTRCVLHSGGVQGPMQYTATLYQDTWAWDGTTWTQITTATPPARARAAMAYDSANDMFVMFGGEVVGGGSAETWTLTGTSWTQRVSSTFPPAPMPQEPATATFDTMRGRTVVTTNRATWSFGGSAGNFGWIDEADLVPGVVNGFGLVYQATAYDAVRNLVVGYGTILTGAVAEWNGVWTTTPDRNPVGGSRSMAAAYDARRGRTVVLDTSGTWEWTGSGWRFFEGAGPTRSDLIAVAFDAACGETVTFGGTRMTNNTSHDETWSFNGTRWLQHPALGPSPPARSLHSMTYDSARNAIVMFGGSQIMSGADQGFVPPDVWEWSGPCDAKVWTRIVAAGPSARYTAALAFDAQRGKTVLFGGNDATGARGDTWEWDGTAWTERPDATTDTSPPAARIEHALAYDPRRQRVILFGGRAGATKLNDSWEWDGTLGTWTELAAVASPSIRSSMTMAADVTGGLIIVGGTNLAGTALRDVYRLRAEQSLQPPEQCTLGTDDTDRDGLLGCTDPDCWLRCAPLCAPGTSCSGPACGDGICSPIEDYLLCPADCVAPP